MIYKFKSKAAGDLIMLGPHGDQLMRIMGRAPAAKGIIEPAQMAAAIAALEQAIADEAAPADAADDENENKPEGPRAVSLRQRAWPLVEMLKRAQAANEPVVWGV
jgi:hypothetical protein